MICLMWLEYILTNDYSKINKIYRKWVINVNVIHLLRKIMNHLQKDMYNLAILIRYFLKLIRWKEKKIYPLV